MENGPRRGRTDYHGVFVIGIVLLQIIHDRIVYPVVHHLLLFGEFAHHPVARSQQFLLLLHQFLLHLLGGSPRNEPLLYLVLRLQHILLQLLGFGVKLAFGLVGLGLEGIAQILGKQIIQHQRIYLDISHIGSFAPYFDRRCRLRFLTGRRRSLLPAVPASGKSQQHRCRHNYFSHRVWFYFRSLRRANI